MAKVRIQARSGDTEDLATSGSELPLVNGDRHQKVQTGALDILTRVWKREGFVGWYQVSHVLLSLIQYVNGASGNASPDHKSSSVAGVAIHVKRTIRTLGFGYHDSCCTISDTLIVTRAWCMYIICIP